MFKAISLKVTLWCGACFAQAMLWEQLSTLRYAVSSSVRAPLGVPQQAVSKCRALSHLLPLKQHSFMKDVLFSVLKTLHRALHFTVPLYAFLKGGVGLKEEDESCLWVYLCCAGSCLVCGITFSSAVFSVPFSSLLLPGIFRCSHCPLRLSRQVGA